MQEDDSEENESPPSTEGESSDSEGEKSDLEDVLAAALNVSIYSRKNTLYCSCIAKFLWLYERVM